MLTFLWQLAMARWTTPFLLWYIQPKLYLYPFPLLCAERQNLNTLEFISLFYFILQYASVKEDGEQFMSVSDFVCKFLQILDEGNPNEETLHRLGAMADTTQDE